MMGTIMDIPATAGEISIAVLALIILKDSLGYFFKKRNGNGHNEKCLTSEDHERICALKFVPINNKLNDLKESAKENKQAINDVMKEIQQIPVKLNGKTKT